MRDRDVWGVSNSVLSKKSEARVQKRGGQGIIHIRECSAAEGTRWKRDKKEHSATTATQLYFPPQSETAEFVREMNSHVVDFSHNNAFYQ